MREMKNMRRLTRATNEAAKEAMEAQHDLEDALAQVKSLKNDQLFTVNVKKDGLKKKRTKLANDRFKQKQQKGTSLIEQELIKRLRNKMPPQVPNVKKPDEFEDLWAAPTQDSLMVKKFKAFTERKVTKVKAVITPLAGQSFNPSAKSHQQVLNRVINEEVKEIEKELKASTKQQTFEEKVQRAQEVAMVADDSSDGENGVETTGAAVDRLKKKTKQQRNKKIANRAQKEMEQDLRKEKKLNHQFNIMHTLIKQDEIAAKKEAKAKVQRNLIEQKEKQLQSKVGIVEKPSVIGRFKYKMRKTDFQLEDELAPSLRQVQPQGTNDLLHDRFDSIFRRNLVEMDAANNAEKKRRRKIQFKFKDRRGGAYGTLAAKLKKKNDKAKQRNDDRESKSWLQNDMILI